MLDSCMLASALLWCICLQGDPHIVKPLPMPAEKLGEVVIPALLSASNIQAVRYRLWGSDVYFEKGLVSDEAQFPALLEVAKSGFYQLRERLSDYHTGILSKKVRYLFTIGRFPEQKTADAFCYSDWVVFLKDWAWIKRGSGWLDAVLIHESAHQWNAIACPESADLEVLYRAAHTHVDPKFYAMRSSAEYFAEASTAFFSAASEKRWPGTRRGLRREDPDLLNFLRRVWKVTAPLDLELYGYLGFAGPPVAVSGRSYDGRESLLNYFTLKDNASFVHMLIKEMDLSGKTRLEAHVLRNPWGTYGADGMTARLYLKTSAGVTRHRGQPVRIEADQWKDVLLELKDIPRLDQVTEIGIEYKLGPTGNSGESSVYTDIPRAF
jgi:hypothetical protein